MKEYQMCVLEKGGADPFFGYSVLLQKDYWLFFLFPDASIGLQLPEGLQDLVHQILHQPAPPKDVSKVLTSTLMIWLLSSALRRYFRPPFHYKYDHWLFDTEVVSIVKDTINLNWPHCVPLNCVLLCHYNPDVLL